MGSLLLSIRYHVSRSRPSKYGSLFGHKSTDPNLFLLDSSCPKEYIAGPTIQGLWIPKVYTRRTLNVLYTYKYTYYSDSILDYFNLL